MCFLPRKISLYGIDPSVKVNYFLNLSADELLVFKSSQAQVFFLMHMDKSHNKTERESKSVGQDILISKKLFLELCRPRGNSFR